MEYFRPEKYDAENILSQEEARDLVSKLKQEKKKIGLCSGSFDLLHPGHIAHLISAKKLCDILIVAVAKDSFSRDKNSGSGRPIFQENTRAFMVSQLKPVDYVIFDDGLFFENNPNDIITLLKPDIYIKGPDYVDGTNPGVKYHRKLLAAWGGEVCYTFDEKISTTDLIKYIKEKVK
jgi:rfaE bifunctional protein nucleotidyltransferase chain/domain